MIPAKSQGVRILDIVLVGPMMVWGGEKLRKDYPTAGVVLALLGVATVLYNGRNYLLVEQNPEYAGALSAGAKIAAKIAAKGGSRLIPFVGVGLMGVDAAREGHRIYKEHRGGQKVGWKEGAARVASASVVGPEGVAWGKKKLAARAR